MRGCTRACCGGSVGCWLLTIVVIGVMQQHSLPHSLTGIYDTRHVLHIEAAALRLQPLQLRTLVVALKV